MVRSEMSARSNSARAAKMPKTSFPDAVVVSLARMMPTSARIQRASSGCWRPQNVNFRTDPLQTPPQTRSESFPFPATLQT